MTVVSNHLIDLFNIFLYFLNFRG